MGGDAENMAPAALGERLAVNYTTLTHANNSFLSAVQINIICTVYSISLDGSTVQYVQKAVGDLVLVLGAWCWRWRRQRRACVGTIHW